MSMFFSGLCEALDQDLRPLCLMPSAAILHQHLRHKMAVILATDGHRYLLKASDMLDVTASGPVQAGLTADESALRLLVKTTGIATKLIHVGQLAEYPSVSWAIPHVFLARYSAPMLETMTSQNLALAEKASLRECPELLTPDLKAVLNLPGV